MVDLVIGFERFIKKLDGQFGKKFGLHSQPDAKNLVNILNLIHLSLPIQKVGWKSKGSWVCMLHLEFKSETLEETDMENFGWLLSMFSLLHASLIQYGEPGLDIVWAKESSERSSKVGLVKRH